MITKQDIELHAATCRENMKGLEGEWQNEPDRVEFKYAGLDCMLVRNNRSLNWCGYVGVPENHPAHGKDYDSDILNDVSVHGGLTYSDSCAVPICHITEGEDKTWWFGFDCAHAGDLSPLNMRYMNTELRKYETYRNAAYVKKETQELAEQLSKIEADAFCRKCGQPLPDDLTCIRCKSEE